MPLAVDANYITDTGAEALCRAFTEARNMNYLYIGTFKASSLSNSRLVDNTYLTPGMKDRLKTEPRIKETV